MGDVSVDIWNQSNADWLRSQEVAALKCNSEEAQAVTKQEVAEKNPFINAPKFGNTQIEQIQASKNLTGQNRATTDLAWNKAGAINTQNTTADSNSPKLGRDNFKAEGKMLDAQLDNKDNSYLKFKGTDGKDYVAFRSESAAYGVYQGFREVDSKEWKNLKEAPTDLNKLKKDLINVHNEKQELIKNHGGNENFKIAQTMRGELNDLKDLYANVASLDSNKSKSEAVLKIEGVFRDLEEIKKGGSKFDVSDIKAKYDAIKTDHPELAADLVMSRLNKVSEILGKDSTEPIKKVLEDKLSSLAAIKSTTGFDFNKVTNKTEALLAIKAADQAVNAQITEKRNQGQQLNAEQKATYDKLRNQVADTINKLQNSKYAGTEEFKKIQKHYENNGNFATDPNAQNRGKHALEELTAFKAHLERNGWTEKANENEASKDVTKVKEMTFKNPQEAGTYLKNMPNGERVFVKFADGKEPGYFTKSSDGNLYRDGGNKLAIEFDLKNFRDMQSIYRYMIERDADKFKISTALNTNTKTPLLIYQNPETNELKVFERTFDQKGIPGDYSEVKPEKLANVDIYSNANPIDKQKNYYQFVPNKNSEIGIWKIQMPEGNLGRITADLIDNQNQSARTDTKKAELNGLEFSFTANQKLIGLSADQQRTNGIAYTEEEFKKAAAKAFGL